MKDRVIRTLVKKLVEHFPLPWYQMGSQVFDRDGDLLVEAANEEEAGVIAFYGEAEYEAGQHGGGTIELWLKGDIELVFSQNLMSQVSIIKLPPPRKAAVPVEPMSRLSGEFSA